MIIFKDIFSGDEIISDSYDLKEIDEVVYECDCAMVTEGGALNIDIGANASAEEVEETLEDNAVYVNNIINNFRLQPTSFDKKSYTSHLKAYMKKIKQKMNDDGADSKAIANFEKRASAYAKKILSNFKDYEFFHGESMELDSMVILLNYRPDGITPYVTIWKDGLAQCKV